MQPGQGSERVEMTSVECRVVGALIEKAATTPDVYPMTTNALVSACNQRSNRDPVVSYDAVIIDGALLELRQRSLVRRVHTQGSRSTKHRQTLDEAIGLDPGELAIVSVLLLRGAQTVGELRQRTERQHEFDSLDAVQSALESLAVRPTPVVVQLARQPGQKEARWQHLLGEDSESAPAVSQAGTAHVSTAPPHAAPASAPGSETTTTPARAAVGIALPDPLAARVEALEAEVAVLRDRLGRLVTSLGESFDES